MNISIRSKNESRDCITGLDFIKSSVLIATNVDADNRATKDTVITELNSEELYKVYGVTFTSLVN